MGQRNILTRLTHATQMIVKRMTAMENFRQNAIDRLLVGIIANINPVIRLFSSGTIIRNGSSLWKALPCAGLPLILAFSVALLWDTAGAADVKLTPKLGVGYAYDDNIFFSAQDKTSSSIFTVSPGLEVDHKTLVSNYLLKADLDILYYDKESDLDRTNQYYRLTGDHRIKERWTTDVDLKYYRDTTLNTYIQDTGRVTDRVERDFFEGGGRLNYDIDMVSGISAGYRFQHAEYEGDQFSDYSRHDGSLDYYHQLKNQVDTISIGPSYYYRTNDFNEINSFALNIGWARKWSEISRSRVFIGVRYTDIERNNGTEDDKWGVRGGFNFTRKGLASTTTFRYVHALRTTVEGDDVNVDNFYLSYRRLITERFGAEFEGRLVFSYALFDQDTQINDERYYRLDPRLFYQLTENLDLSLRYRYQNNFEERDQGDRTRERNIVWLQLKYAVPLPI